MKKRIFIYIAMVGTVLLLAMSLMPKSIYASYDLDGDGIVTQEEMEQWANNQGVNGIKGLAELWNSPEYIETYGEGKSTSSSSTQDSNKKEAHTHSYTATVTKEPTCTEAGEMTYKCSCGDTYTEVIPMRPHDYESTVTKEPTCTETGTETKVCKDCGDTIESVIPALGHKPGDWTVEKEPTCSEEGRTVKRCKVCNEVVESMTIDKRPHTEGEWEVAQKPTLTKTGLKVVKCTECGEVLKEEVIPANTTLLYILIGLGGVAVIGVVAGIVVYKRRH